MLCDFSIWRNTPVRNALSGWTDVGGEKFESQHVSNAMTASSGPVDSTTFAAD